MGIHGNCKKNFALMDIDEEKVGLVSQAGEEKDDTPKFGFLFFGLVSLFAFTYFIQVIGLLTSKTLPIFASAATMIYGISSNLGQLFSIFVAYRMSFGRRIWISCFIIAMTCIFYPSFINSHIPGGFFSGLLITIGLGFSNALIQSAGFGLAACVSDSAINYFSFGQSLAGIICWPLQIALHYFFAEIGFNTERINSRPSMVESWTISVGFFIVAMTTLSMIPFFVFWLSSAPAVRRAFHKLSIAKTTGQPERDFLVIFGDTLPLALSVWFVLFATFLVFPGVVLTMIPRFDKFPGGRPFFSALLIFVFQVFDVLGKLFTLIGVVLNPRQVKILSPTRILIALLIYLSAADLTILKYDGMKIFLVAVLAFTNGALINSAMMHGPSQVRPAEADRAGYIMAFFLVNGILFGSLVSLFIGNLPDITPKVAETASELMIIINPHEN